MAKIKKIYDDAATTNQVYPQTHEKAVIDNNGTTLESKLGQVIDLVNQKQMEVGAIESDLIPTKDSTHWVTSGGVQAALSGVDDVLYGPYKAAETVTPTFVQGGIQTDGTPNSVTRRIRTGYVKVDGHFTVSLTSPDKFNIYYYTAEDFSTFVKRHEGFITTGIYSDTYSGYIIIAAAKTNDDPVQPSEGSVTVSGDVRGSGLVDKVSQLSGVHESEESIDVSFSLGAWNAYTGAFSSATKRMASPKIYVNGGSLKFKMNTGYKYTLMLFDDNDNVVANLTSEWQESDASYHYLSGLHGYLTFNVSKSDDSTISSIPDFGFELALIGDYTSIPRSVDFAKRNNGTGFTYTGAPISLQKRNYWLRRHNGQAVISSFTQQGMAIHGDIVIYGSSTESGGETKVAVGNLSDNTIIKNITLSHPGYSAIHSNVLCFGADMGSGTLPYLYVSQWNEEHGCFVYDFAADYTPTLTQVILPTDVSTDKIGIGNIDWIVDTDNRRLVSIGYTDTVSTVTAVNGMKVCIFELPALTDSVVELADEDILDSFSIDEFYVRQDCCYCNGNIYMSCGYGTNPTTDLNKIAVISLSAHGVVSVVDLKWLPKEPEGLDVYNGSLILRCLGQAEMYRLIFE